MRRVLLLVLPLLVATVHAAEVQPSTALRPDGSSGAAPANPPGSPGTPEATKLAGGLNAVVNLAFGPDGSLYFGEWKTGAVYRLVDGKPENFGNPVLDVGEPAWGNERGFVGLAVDAQGSFYTFTTYARGDGSYFNRVARWDGGKETAILDNLPAGDWHNAGRIHVDPRDGSIWVAYGDVNNRPAAADPSDLRGSILHMTREGGPVPGNVADGSLVYSYGHRQPFGFAIEWSTGRVMVAENMDKKNDEVSLVRKGGNHGWPTCEGPCATPRGDLVEPILYYPVTIGPTSGAFLAGSFYFGDFNLGQLHRVFEHDGKWWDEVVYRHDGPILDLKAGPEGNTFYFSDWASIWKLTFPNVPKGNGTGNGTGPGPGPAPDPDPVDGPFARTPALAVGVAAGAVAVGAYALRRRR